MWETVLPSGYMWIFQDFGGTREHALSIITEGLLLEFAKTYTTNTNHAYSIYMG